MDMLNLSANERLDLADLSYATFDSQLGLHKAITSQVMMDPSAAAPAYILSGFAATNPSGTQVTVTKGVALLPYRTDTQVLYGLVATDGPTVQTLDLSTRAAGTYTVYITFSYQPGATDTRTLWSSDNGGAEYASAVPTRLVAGWQLAIESASPGAEWLPIAQVTTPSMAIVDMRPFYFEGRPDQSFVPQWGTTADRATTRATNPVTNLQTFVQAMQQCLIDIKGPGIANWYTPYIAGQTIGYKGTAKAASTAWYDANFYAQGDASNPRHVYSSDGAALAYARGLNAFTVTGGTAATATTLNFAAPGTAVGTKGPYSLTTSATNFALNDTANSLNPLSYTASTETLDLSAGGLGTVVLPLPPQVKYSAPTTVSNYLSLLDIRMFSGLIFYPASAASTTTLPQINGQLAFGFSANTSQVNFVIPIRVPDACTLTQIEYGVYVSPQVSVSAFIMRKPCKVQTQTVPSTNTNAATAVATTTLPGQYYVPASAAGTPSSNVATYAYFYKDVALSIPVLSTDANQFFLQVVMNLNVATSSTNDTLSSASMYIDYIKLSYTIAGPALGGVR